jgi:hypothetical protein
MYTLKSETAEIVFDPSGRIQSFRLPGEGNREFISANKAPAFRLQYPEEHEIREIDADQAADISAEETAQGIRFRYKNLNGSPLEAVTEAFSENGAIAFMFSLHNPQAIPICSVQYPMVILKYKLGGADKSETILRPFNAGQLIEAPRPEVLEPDCPQAWIFRPENGNTSHYPGQTFAQFLAYYNNEAGIYIACDDTLGHIKIIKPVHNREGLRLGFLHAGDWRTRRDLGYRVIIRGFRGDWYDAADIYRDWSGKQAWAIPLGERKNFPRWLLDSPVHIVFRMQGQVDVGPVAPNEEFLPYEKNIPLLEKLSRQLEAPVLPVFMSWEKNGPWTYPDSFPPVGGEESLKKFCAEAAKRGWHTGTYCNGTRWVTAHYWSGYDGRPYLKKSGGEASLCRTAAQEPWREVWDKTWRESYMQCIGTEKTKKLAGEFCRTLAEDGLDYIQFFDQNNGGAAFPCYAGDHGHPPMPDIWMTGGMEELCSRLKKIREDLGREVAFPMEQPANEWIMQSVDLCDVRVAPPGHADWKVPFFPLYHYLYHEYILLQGSFGNGQDPYHTQIRTAFSFILGQMVGGVVKGSGEFLSGDNRIQPWSLWDEETNSNDEILAILKNTSALRRGAGRPYLVFGRMQRPAPVDGIKAISWQYRGIDNHVPAVFHSAWKSPEGRFAVILVNWTNEKQEVFFTDPRLSPDPIPVRIDPLGCAIRESPVLQKFLK